MGFSLSEYQGILHRLCIKLNKCQNLKIKIASFSPLPTLIQNLVEPMKSYEDILFEVRAFAMDSNN